VEGIKGCQMTGRSLGRAWQLEEGENPKTRCVGNLLVVSVCVSLLSLIDAERQSWRP
jgi:hypothetical protein